jgi:hypothetical protein
MNELKTGWIMRWQCGEPILWVGVTEKMLYNEMPHRVLLRIFVFSVLVPLFRLYSSHPLSFYFCRKKFGNVLVKFRFFLRISTLKSDVFQNVAFVAHLTHFVKAIFVKALKHLDAVGKDQDSINKRQPWKIRLFRYKFFLYRGSYVPALKSTKICLTSTVSF